MASLHEQSLDEIKNELNDEKSNNNVSISLINQELTIIQNNTNELNRVNIINHNKFEEFKTNSTSKIDFLKNDVVRKQSTTNLSIEKLNKIMTVLTNNVRNDLTDMKNLNNNMIENLKIELNSSIENLNEKQ